LMLHFRDLAVFLWGDSQTLSISVIVNFLTL